MSGDAKPRIAERAARELHPGEVVNLGIGIPNLIPGFLGADTQVVLHTENGLLGVGPRPGDDELDPDLIDAAKQPITALPGAAYFDSASSFAMIRGGHVDVAVLGALEVSARGDIANWAVPGKDVLGVGGAWTSSSAPSRDRDDDRDLVARRAEGRGRVHATRSPPQAVDVIVTEFSRLPLLDGAQLRVAREHVDVLGVGGAMDLVVGARRVIVTMTATSSRGEPKVVAECTYPLTAAGAADVIITELSVFRLLDGQLHLTELLDGVTLDDVAAVTTAPYVISLEESHAR